MKLFIQLSFLLLLASQNCFGQDTNSIINESWTTLKTQLQRRTDIVSNLTSLLSKSSKVDKEQLNNSKVLAVDLFKYIDTLNIKDSLSVSLVSVKNNKLTQALARTIVTLENDKKFRSNNEVNGLLMQLEGCENRIALAKREYNEICKEFKKADLLFGLDQIEKAPEVKF